MINKIRSFIGVLKEAKNPGKLVLAQVLVKTGLNKFFTISMKGYKLAFSNSALAVTLFADRNERHDDEDLIRRMLKPGDVYADVGANIGTLALTAATSVMPNGKVIAIEAHPDTFEKLQKNIQLNKFDHIQTINSAAGNTKGTIKFSNINSDDQNKVVADAGQGINVQVNTLDGLLQSTDAIRLLKIDVEGYEKFVLEGAEKTLLKTDVVLFESWDMHFKAFGYSVSDVINLLHKNAFKVYKPMGDLLEEVHEDYASVQCENLLAIKDVVGFCSQAGFKIQIPK